MTPSMYVTQQILVLLNTSNITLLFRSHWWLLISGQYNKIIHSLSSSSLYYLPHNVCYYFHKGAILWIAEKMCTHTHCALAELRQYKDRFSGRQEDIHIIFIYWKNFFASGLQGGFCLERIPVYSSFILLSNGSMLTLSLSVSPSLLLFFFLNLTHPFSLFHSMNLCFVFVVGKCSPG